MVTISRGREDLELEVEKRIPVIMHSLGRGLLCCEDDH